MFLLNSCLSLFSAAHLGGHPFSRSYGVILPSSLTMLLPSALGFSPHPPVSVYGTGSVYTIAAFLATRIQLLRYLSFAAHHVFALWGDLVPHGYLACTGFSSPAAPIRMCPRFSDIQRCWNLDQLSISYAFLPHLRSRLSRRRSALRRKPWIFGRKDSHLPLATHSGILSSIQSTRPYSLASLRMQCSPTNTFQHSQASVSCLAT